MNLMKAKKMKSSWSQMLGRCYDPLNHKYHRYGGRGIRVCDRWLCYRLFLEDMGERPEGKTLNRIDNDKGYSPDNCEWATPEQQSQNRGDNNNICFKGETLCITAWARKVGMRRETLRKRISNGWSIENALTVPVGSVSTRGEMKNEDDNVR